MAAHARTESEAFIEKCSTTVWRFGVGLNFLGSGLRPWLFVGFRALGVESWQEPNTGASKMADSSTCETGKLANTQIENPLT